MVKLRALFLTFVLFLPALTSVGGPAQAFEKDTLTIVDASGNQHRFTVEVARTPSEQARGLMFRRDMAADAGMLFIAEPPRVLSMWMANTYLPLDMLFIDESGTIVKIERDTTPLSRDTISSGQPVRAVLELNAGTSDELGIAEGNQVRHKIFN